MQQHNFKRKLIAASVALTLGVTGTAVAASTTDTGEVKPAASAIPSISNTATASYTVDGLKQKDVQSNEVTVHISPVAQFTLEGLLGAQPDDDKNENLPATPGKTTTFKNKLANLGNESDTYTLEIKNEDNTSIDTADDLYDFADVNNIVMTVQKKKISDNTNIGSEIQVNNGGTLKLEKGEYAIITYEAKTPKSIKGGKTATLTLSATSEDIAKLDPSKKTLVNENQTYAQVPVFKIQKTALTQSGADLTRIDLNKINKFSYKIKVTNDSSKTFTTKVVNALIQDTLPKGIELDESTSITINSTDSSTKEGTLDTSLTGVDGCQIISVNGIDLSVGETITITIPVKITDKDTLVAAGNATNHADVYDNYDDTVVEPRSPNDADIHDSTDNTSDTPNVEDKDDDDTTTELPTTKRSIAIGDGTTKELPKTSAPSLPASYENTITNNGTEDEANVKFKITDTAGDDVDVINPKFTQEDNTVIELKEDPANSGTYVAKDGTPITIPKGTTGKLTYDVTSNEATAGSYPNVVDVIPAPGTNNDAPEVTEKTNTTQVKVLDPKKEQVIDADCDGSPDEGYSFSKNPITDAKPGQCIVYKITVQNPFTTKALTDVTITDEANNWKSGATYVNASTKVSTGGVVAESPVSNTGSVKATFTTIAANSNGWVQFAVKINK